MVASNQDIKPFDERAYEFTDKLFHSYPEFKIKDVNKLRNIFIDIVKTHLMLTFAKKKLNIKKYTVLKNDIRQIVAEYLGFSSCFYDEEHSIPKMCINTLTLLDLLNISLNKDIKRINAKCRKNNQITHQAIESNIYKFYKILSKYERKGTAIYSQICELYNTLYPQENIRYKDMDVIKTICARARKRRTRK